MTLRTYNNITTVVFFPILLCYSIIGGCCDLLVRVLFPDETSLRRSVHLPDHYSTKANTNL